MDLNIKKGSAIKQIRLDFCKFKKYYFSHYCYKRENLLHKYLRKKVFKNIASNAGKKYAIAAPRGHGKTTDILIFIIYCIVYDLKKFIVIFSNTIDLSSNIINDIKDELCENEKLREDFPFLSEKLIKNSRDEIITSNDIKIKALSVSKRVRGIKHKEVRPDFVILDDLENDINVLNKYQRDKLEEWLDDAIGYIGSILSSNLDILFIGTILHSDSVLARKLKKKDFNPKKFQAIVKYPDRLDLWEEFDKIYRSDPKNAESYYKKNKKLLNAGAKLMWSDGVRLYDLMCKRASNYFSFNKELQNEPLGENSIFKREYFNFYNSISLKKLKIFGFCDSAGSSINSDYTSITILGISEGKFYLLENINKILRSFDIVKLIVELQIKYKCKLFGFETNGGQFHLKDWILKEAYEKSIIMPLKGVHHSDSKLSRIESLLMPIVNNEIYFNNDCDLLLSQLLEFPQNDYDDAMDSLAGCYMLALKYKDANNIMKRKRIIQRR